MEEDEALGRRALLRAEAIADDFGVGIHRRTVRARDAGRAIVELAEQTGADVVVIEAPRRRRAYGRRSPFGATVRNVLMKAPCRVLVVAPPVR
jgi:nucleotide-binding universal stress UspA family protein